MPSDKLEDLTSPQTQVSPKPQGPGGGLLWHHAWTAIFAANLVVPMMFASDFLDKGSEVGMALAVVLLWLLGDLAGVRSRDRRFVLISGGIAVAISQVVPILQIIAGGVSLGIAREFSGGPAEKLSGFGGFLATFFTGAFLLLASCLAGLLIRQLGRLANVSRAPAGPTPQGRG